MPTEKHFYEVIVGNIGKVYEGANYSSALRAYGNYVRASKMGHGRAGGEQVSLWKDGNPIKEHDETEPGYTSNPGSKKIVGVALNPSGKFLGFIDGSGRIRKGRVRRLRNPGYMVSAYKSFSPSYLTAKTLTEAKRIAKRIKAQSGGYTRKVYIRKA